MTESELVQLLKVHDAMVQSCVAGDLSLGEFLKRYDDFPQRYALDGHEADEVEGEILRRHSPGVAFHLGVLNALSGLCREEDAERPEYLRAGRFGPIEGLKRLRQYVQQHGA